MILFGVLGLGICALLIAGAAVGVDPYDSLAAVFVLLAVAAWAAALISTHANRLRPNPVAGERAWVAQRDAFVATVVALLGLRRLLEVPVPAEAVTVGLVVALLAVCLYSVRFLVWYFRGEYEI